jgi:hypothetical protein
MIISTGDNVKHNYTDQTICHVMTAKEIPRRKFKDYPHLSPTLKVHGPCGAPVTHHMWESTDGGVTWKNIAHSTCAEHVSEDGIRMIRVFPVSETPVVW